MNDFETEDWAVLFVAAVVCIMIVTVAVALSL
jgi:hypothetical protein